MLAALLVVKAGLGAAPVAAAAGERPRARRGLALPGPAPGRGVCGGGRQLGAEQEQQHAAGVMQLSHCLALIQGSPGVPNMKGAGAGAAGCAACCCGGGGAGGGWARAAAAAGRRTLTAWRLARAGWPASTWGYCSEVEAGSGEACGRSGCAQSQRMAAPLIRRVVDTTLDHELVRKCGRGNSAVWSWLAVAGGKQTEGWELCETTRAGELPNTECPPASS